MFCLGLLNRTVFTGKNVSLASAICLSMISLGFTFRSWLSISCKRDAARPSLNVEIAISLKWFNVTTLLCLVVLFSVMQMLVKQGRWSEMLLIITPDEVLMLCISSCSLGVLIYRAYLIEETTAISGKSCWNCYLRKEATGTYVIKQRNR